MAATYNFLDLSVVFFLLLSGLVGVIRGFTKEVLSIAAWIGALFVTLYGMPLLKPFSHSLISHPFLADLAVLFGLFLISLILFSLFISALSNTVKSSVLGGLDRSLGLSFGVVRGAVLVVLAFMGACTIWKDVPDRPLVMQQARLLPFVSQGAKIIVSLLPRGLFSEETLRGFHGSPEKSAEDLMRELGRPKTSLLVEDKKKTNDQKGLDHLIQDMEE